MHYISEDVTYCQVLALWADMVMCQKSKKNFGKLQCPTRQQSPNGYFSKKGHSQSHNVNGCQLKGFH